MASTNNVSTSNTDGNVNSNDVAVPSISLCLSQPPLPLETSKQWRYALDFISQAVDNKINLLACKCSNGVHLIDPKMNGIFVKLNEFQDVALKLAGSDPEAEAHQAELILLDTRLKKAVEEAKARAGL
ncbi:hypothetical protein QFC21_006056 [Naganishia friedmannii]|uniref:Uncharacterized protein n=1 Tax=Naganishia friedmannii TaxID=89922 RepID=A0ACC2V5P2_9TREE|nr:hypothetical protein QFC21_006056 [Naganishia friedmannii]